MFVSGRSQSIPEKSLEDRNLSRRIFIDRNLQRRVLWRSPTIFFKLVTPNTPLSFSAIQSLEFDNSYLDLTLSQSSRAADHPPSPCRRHSRGPSQGVFRPLSALKKMTPTYYLDEAIQVNQKHGDSILTSTSALCGDSKNPFRMLYAFGPNINTRKGKRL